jgi:hypothetical protein
MRCGIFFVVGARVSIAEGSPAEGRLENHESENSRRTRLTASGQRPEFIWLRGCHRPLGLRQPHTGPRHALADVARPAALEVHRAEHENSAI